MPSSREIQHLYPMPQPAYPKRSLPDESKDVVLMCNPSTFMINDIVVGVVNADIIKDICGSILTKQSKESKIELSLKSIL